MRGSRLTAALAAILAIGAIVGATSASATMTSYPTTFCKSVAFVSEVGQTCSPEDVLPVGSEVNFHTEYEWIWYAAGEFLQTNCKNVTLGMKITSEAPDSKHAMPVRAGGTGMAFSGCNRVVKVIRPGEWEIGFEGAPSGEWQNATVWWRGFQIEVQAGVPCVFGGEVQAQVSMNGYKVKFENAALPKESGSIFCPPYSRVAATFDAEGTWSIARPE